MGGRAGTMEYRPAACSKVYNNRKREWAWGWGWGAVEVGAVGVGLPFQCHALPSVLSLDSRVSRERFLMWVECVPSKHNRLGTQSLVRQCSEQGWGTADGTAQVTCLCPGCDRLVQGGSWSPLLSALQPVTRASLDTCWSLHVGHLFFPEPRDRWFGGLHTRCA